MVLRSFWRQNQLHGTHSFQENTILVNQFGWYKIIMAKIQCVLSRYCTSFHETIYKGTNTCAIGIGYMALLGLGAKCRSGWVDTPWTVMTTRVPAVLKSHPGTDPDSVGLITCSSYLVQVHFLESQGLRSLKHLKQKLSLWRHIFRRKNVGILLKHMSG